MEVFKASYLCSATFDALSGYFPEVFLVPAAQSQQSTEFGEQDAGPGPDARAGAGYQGYLPPEGGHLEHTLRGGCCPHRGNAFSYRLTLKASPELMGRPSSPPTRRNNGRRKRAGPAQIPGTSRSLQLRHIPGTTSETRNVTFERQL